MHLQDLGAARIERRLVLVYCRLRAELVLRELQLAIILQLRVGGFGLGRGEVRLRLVHLRLKLHLLDLVQQVAGLHVLAFAERDFFEKTLDARPDIDLVDRLDMPDELKGLADASHRGKPHADGRVCHRRGSLFLLVTTRQERQGETGQKKEMQA